MHVLTAAIGERIYSENAARNSPTSAVADQRVSAAPAMQPGRLGDSRVCCLPEILCLWATERSSEWHRRIKNLRPVIQQGNWASRRVPADHRLLLALTKRRADSTSTRFSSKPSRVRAYFRVARDSPTDASFLKN